MSDGKKNISRANSIGKAYWQAEFDQSCEQVFTCKRRTTFPWRHHINLIYVGLYAIKFNTELDNIPNLQSKSNLLIRQMEPTPVCAMCSQPTTSRSAHLSWWSSPWKRCCLDCCFFFWSILCQVDPGVHPCAPEWPENPSFWSRLTFETSNQQLS